MSLIVTMMYSNFKTIDNNKFQTDIVNSLLFTYNIKSHTADTYTALFDDE